MKAGRPISNGNKEVEAEGQARAIVCRVKRQNNTRFGEGRGTPPQFLWSAHLAASSFLISCPTIGGGAPVTCSKPSDLRDCGATQPMIRRAQDLLWRVRRLAVVSM
jgi:hypothetical protein